MHTAGRDLVTESTIHDNINNYVQRSRFSGNETITTWFSIFLKSRSEPMIEDYNLNQKRQKYCYKKKGSQKSPLLGSLISCIHWTRKELTLHTQSCSQGLCMDNTWITESVYTIHVLAQQVKIPVLHRCLCTSISHVLTYYWSNGTAKEDCCYISTHYNFLQKKRVKQEY